MFRPEDQERADREETIINLQRSVYEFEKKYDNMENIIEVVLLPRLEHISNKFSLVFPEHVDPTEFKNMLWRRWRQLKDLQTEFNKFFSNAREKLKKLRNITKLDNFTLMVFQIDARDCEACFKAARMVDSQFADISQKAFDNVHLLILWDPDYEFDP